MKRVIFTLILDIVARERRERNPQEEMSRKCRVRKGWSWGHRVGWYSSRDLNALAIIPQCAMLGAETMNEESRSTFIDARIGVALGGVPARLCLISGWMEVDGAWT
jgi:hypothetical protein